MEKKEKKEPGLYFRFFNEADTAMAVLNREGLILAANEKFQNILASICQSGTNTGSGQKQLPSSIREIPDPLYTQVFWSSLLPVLNGEKKHVVFECTFNFPKESSVVADIPHWFNAHAWLIEEASPERNSPEAERLIGLVLDDYTLVRQEEKKLLLGKEIAEKAMEAKDQFLANMSHEIRTPIQTIIGMIELLQETNLDREQTEYSRQVKFSTEVLLTLINDILDYSKIEAGKMELEHIDFDLEQIIEQAVEMIALEAHRKDLYITTNIPSETSIIIKGDPSKFRQIMINLVKNAVKFTSDGGITVSVNLTKLPDSEAVRVSVADTGIGVNEETRPKLFSTFMQADVSNTRRFGGTGLGLAISNNLVNLMKGKIEMVPNEGGGSIFRFEVPLDRSGDKPEPLPPPEMNGKLRILIVDDRAPEREIIGSRLREMGYTDISQADSGETAIRMLKEASDKDCAFHLCFLDMIMPVMDGWRLAAEIHNDTEIRQPDLILMVPHGLMGADTKMTLLKWFKAYINKPIKRRSLAETISLVLNEPQELEEAAVLEEQIDAEDPDHKKDIPVLLEAEGSFVQPSGKSSVPLKSKLPVLIAEDHPVNQKLFSMIMDKQGYSSILADDGLDALEKIAANQVALVFMDIQMPRMNGYEAAENLRKQGFKKPIIAVTASALSDERQHCLNSGIDDVLVKPFKRPDIEKMLQKWIVISETTPEATLIPIEEFPLEITEPAVNEQGSVFCAEEILDTFMGNREMVLQLLLRFINRTQEQIKNLPYLEKAENFEAARMEAHTIKGAAYTMSGTELAKASARLELAYKNIDREEMKAAFPPVTGAFARFKKEAEDFLSRN